MVGPRAGDSQYFFTWTLVDDSARARMIPLIIADPTGEVWPEPLYWEILPLKVHFKAMSMSKNAYIDLIDFNLISYKNISE